MEDYMNREFLDLAFELANKAFNLDEVPIGAVIVKNNKIIGCGYNKKERKKQDIKK